MEHGNTAVDVEHPPVVEAAMSDDPPSPKPVCALSTTQERKLVDYLEDQFLDVTRNYKKRQVHSLVKCRA